MMKTQVKKLTTAYLAVLSKQGEIDLNQEMQTMCQQLMVATNNALQKNLNSITLSESGELGKLVTEFSGTLDTIEDISFNIAKSDAITKALNHTNKVYNYFENKWDEEIYDKSDEVRKDFIFAVLLPAMMLNDYLSKEKRH